MSTINILCKDLLNISGIALCSVADEDFVGADLDASCSIVTGGYGLSQEFIALLRTVAVKTFHTSQFFDCVVHRGDDSFAQGLSDIAYAEGDDIVDCQGLPESLGFRCNCCKQVGSRQLEVIIIDAYHLL